MITIARILKTTYAGLNIPDEVISTLQALRNAFELTYDIQFTPDQALSSDERMSFYSYYSSNVRIVLITHIANRVYIVKIRMKKVNYEQFTHQILDKYVNSYTTQELIAKAYKSLEQGSDIDTSILMDGSYNGTMPPDKEISQLLNIALNHSSPQIRSNACWDAFANEIYWEVTLPKLRELADQDADENVRLSAQGAIECMFLDEEEEV